MTTFKLTNRAKFQITKRSIPYYLAPLLDLSGDLRLEYPVLEDLLRSLRYVETFDTELHFKMCTTLDSFWVMRDKMLLVHFGKEKVQLIYDTNFTYNEIPTEFILELVGCIVEPDVDRTYIDGKLYSMKYDCSSFIPRHHIFTDIRGSQLVESLEIRVEDRVVEHVCTTQQAATFLICQRIGGDTRFVNTR